MIRRLTNAELENFATEHVQNGYPWCVRCGLAWPCSTARLLEHFLPGPVPHLAGIQASLFGQSTSEGGQHG